MYHNMRNHWTPASSATITTVTEAEALLARLQSWQKMTNAGPFSALGMWCQSTMYPKPHSHMTQWSLTIALQRRLMMGNDLSQWSGLCGIYWMLVFWYVLACQNWVPNVHQQAKVCRRPCQCHARNDQFLRQIFMKGCLAAKLWHVLVCAGTTRFCQMPPSIHAKLPL